MGPPDPVVPAAGRHPRHPQHRHALLRQRVGVEEQQCAEDVATDLIELANGHPFGGNLVGVKRSSKSVQE